MGCAVKEQQRPVCLQHTDGTAVPTAGCCASAECTWPQRQEAAYLWEVAQRFIDVVHVINLQDMRFWDTSGDEAMWLFGGPLLEVVRQVSLPDEALSYTVAARPLLACTHTNKQELRHSDLVVNKDWCHRHNARCSC